MSNRDFFPFLKLLNSDLGKDYPLLKPDALQEDQGGWPGQGANGAAQDVVPQSQARRLQEQPILQTDGCCPWYVPRITNCRRKNVLLLM